MANQIVMMALGWHLYTLTHSPLSLGYLGLVLFLPQVFLVLIVGQVADRFNRRKIILTTQCLEAIISLTLCASVLLKIESSHWIFIAAFCIGSVRAFQGPALQALLPNLVGLDLLPKAIALGSASRQFATIAGPALGGLLFLGGTTFVYASSGLFFIIAFTQIFAIRFSQQAQLQAPVTREFLFAGIKFIWQRKVVLGAISLDLFSVLLGGATALLPIYAEQILHVGAVGLGFLRGGPAIGALILAIYLARYPLQKNAGRIMFMCVGIFGVTTIVFGLSEWFLVSLIALVVMGAADMVSVVIRSTLVQLQTPNEMRGRVGAVNSIFIGASNQLGEFESGVSAELLGVVPAVVVGGIGTLVIVAIWLKLFPELYDWGKAKHEDEK
ncbi:MAG: MFS transporter [Gammaproteobacteria bacterium]|nr:MAG: MFS transporter [Gammaproteobacteria bacterium]